MSEISTGAEYASYDEMMEHFRSTTVGDRITPIQNHMLPRLSEAYIDVLEALRVFNNVVNAETDVLVGHFFRWLDLTESFHHATLDESTQERGSEQ